MNAMLTRIRLTTPKWMLIVSGVFAFVIGLVPLLGITGGMVGATIAVVGILTQIARETRSLPTLFATATSKRDYVNAYYLYLTIWLAVVALLNATAQTLGDWMLNSLLAKTNFAIPLVTSALTGVLAMTLPLIVAAFGLPALFGAKPQVGLPITAGIIAALFMVGTTLN